MIQIEQNLKNNYISVLRNNGFPEKEHGYYLKWLGYYLDFCYKYDFDRSDLNSLPRFIEKLCSKRQNENQLQQATDAVRFFYSLIKPDDFSENSTPEIKEHILSYPKKEKVKTEPNEKINDHVFNQSWQEAYQSLENRWCCKSKKTPIYSGGSFQEGSGFSYCQLKISL